MPDHEKQVGKHRDPLNRRRSHGDDPVPETLGVDIVRKLKTEEPKLYGDQKRA